MYLWILLQKSLQELVKRVFLAQVEIKTKNSWVEKVKEDLLSVNINLSFKEISNLSKFQFKKIIHSKLSIASKECLRKQQNTHTKTKFLQFQDKIKSYLISHKLTFIEKQTLYKLRCRVENVKNNYRALYHDLKCVFCREENTIDCVDHYLKCNYLSKHKLIGPKVRNASYSDLFNDIDLQIRFIKLWI